MLDVMCRVSPNLMWRQRRFNQSTQARVSSSTGSACRQRPLLRMSSVSQTSLKLSASALSFESLTEPMEANAVKSASHSVCVVESYFDRHRGARSPAREQVSVEADGHVQRVDDELGSHP